eukprot:gene3085-biopygen541
MRRVRRLLRRARQLVGGQQAEAEVGAVLDEQLRNARDAERVAQRGAEPRRKAFFFFLLGLLLLGRGRLHPLEQRAAIHDAVHRVPHAEDPLKDPAVEVVVPAEAAAVGDASSAFPILEASLELEIPPPPSKFQDLAGDGRPEAGPRG